MFGIAGTAPLTRMRWKRCSPGSSASPSPTPIWIARLDPGDASRDLRLLGEGLVALDRGHAAADPGEERGHVAGAGADLEHRLPGLGGERHEHGRDRLGAVMVWPQASGSETSVRARSAKRRGAKSSRRTRSIAPSTAVSRMPRARSDRTNEAASTASRGASRSLSGGESCMAGLKGEQVPT